MSTEYREAEKEGGGGREQEKLTKETKLGLLNVRTRLQAHHFGVIRRQERCDMIPVAWVNVMVHPRWGHTRGAGGRNAWSRHGIGVENRGLVGLVRLIDCYWILRRDLLIQRLPLDPNDTFEERINIRTAAYTIAFRSHTIGLFDSNLVGWGSIGVRFLRELRGAILLRSRYE